MIKILSNNRIERVHRDDVFKKSELIGDYHWDSLTNQDRALTLKSVNLDTIYCKSNWANLKPEIRSVLKEVSPAGTTTATTGVHNPVYNPINEEKPLSDRIDDEIDRQHKMPSHEEFENGKGDGGGKDEKKGKD